MNVLQLLSLCMFAALTAYVAWALWQHGREGGVWDWGRAYARTVRVRLSYEETHEVCHRALSEVLQTMTSERRRRGRVGAWARLRRPGRTERHRLEFTVERAAAGATDVRVCSTGATGIWTSVIHPGTTRERRRQVHALAERIAAAGHGRMLDST